MLSQFSEVLPERISNWDQSHHSADMQQHMMRIVGTVRPVFVVCQRNKYDSGHNTGLMIQVVVIMEVMSIV